MVQVVTVEQVPSTGKPEIKAGFFRLDRDNVLTARHGILLRLVPVALRRWTRLPQGFSVQQAFLVKPSFLLVRFDCEGGSDIAHPVRFQRQGHRLADVLLGGNGPRKRHMTLVGGDGDSPD